MKAGHACIRLQTIRAELLSVEELRVCRNRGSE
jgi:hypothetical protein